MNNISTEMVLQVLGVVFIGLGIAGLVGRWKNWYWRSPRSIYGYIPFGLMFILASMEKPIRAQLANATWILIGAYVVLFALGLWGFIRPPSFLQPQWLRPIEAQPRSVYLEMATQVKAGLDWRARVADPQALEKWIKEVRRKQPKAEKKNK
jgi:hypothetical protein